MAFQMFCPSCKLALTGTPQRCPTCGNLATLAPGTNIQGFAGAAYTVISILGIGGMGIVYKCTDIFGQDCVVKELYCDNPTDLPDAQRRFRREASVQASISHAAFPAGYGYFQDPNLGNREFMAMEFIEGGDLEKVLANAPGGKLGEDEVLEIGIKVCDGLEAMHNYHDAATGMSDPLIHRDIKPANIIQTPAGEIKILDLGIARAVRQSATTQARQTQAGTAEYAMPEVVLGTPTTRSDIGALAATMYHLVMGQAFPPMDWDTWLALVDNMPATWRAIFRKALAKDEQLRHRTITEFRADLVGLLPIALRQQFITTPPPQPVPSLTPTAQVSILWNPIAPTLLPGHNEYRAVVSGRVMQGGQGVPAVNVSIPLVSDTGGRGRSTATQIHGDFSLGLADTTVPVAVKQRQLTIVVEDPNTGAELYREVISLNRPASFQRVKASVWGMIAAPFKAISQWRQNRQLAKHRRLAAKAPMIQAKAQAHQARIAAKAQAYQAKQAANLARQQAKAQAAAAKAQAKATAQAAKAAVPSRWQRLKTWFQSLNKAQWAKLFTVLVALIALAVTLYAISKEWTYTWTFCFWLTILSTILFFFARWGKLKLGVGVMALPTLLYLGIWFAFLLT